MASKPIYTVTQVKVPALYDSLKRWMVHSKQDDISSGIVMFPNHYVSVDAAPWGALDAYRFIREDNTPIGNFLLCYADRFVEIRFGPWYDGAEPTEKQMALVGTVLGSGPLS